jgi:hypothetical protein
MVYVCRGFLYFNGRMKEIFVGLLIAVCVQMVHGQVIRVPVGASYFVSKKSYSISHTSYCKNTSQVCIYNLNTSVYETPNHGFNGRSLSTTNPDHNYPYSFYYTDNLKFYFTTDTVSSFNDTVLYDYSLYNVKNDCGAICPSSQSMSVIERYNIVSYYDSVVRVNNYGKDTLTFERGLNDTYYDIMHYSFGIFNNLSDTLYCDSISIIADTSVNIEMKSSVDTIDYTNFTVSPFNRATPNFNFSTNTVLFIDTTFVNSTISLYANSRGVDTVIAFPVAFQFNPKEKSIVSTKGRVNVNSLKVVNPITNGRLHLFVNLSQKVASIIECFDIMGNSINRVHDGLIDAGEHEFSAELPTGMYYVRMQAGDEVLTRKVTVVR